MALQFCLLYCKGMKRSLSLRVNEEQRLEVLDKGY
jgi:hypothetical protein